MKLEVGQFVRTKRDGIGKIISLSIGEEDECCFIELSKRRTGIKEHNILKASHNIIDLIEVGDFIDHLEVMAIEGNYIVFREATFTKNGLKNYGVKSIVTREQFSAMEYKID